MKLDLNDRLHLVYETLKVLVMILHGRVVLIK